MLVMIDEVLRHSFRIAFLYLRQVSEGMSFSEATTLAREMGYTERIREMIFLVWMWRVNY